MLDQTAPTSDLSETIFWYRSELQLPTYKLGNPVFHTLSETHKRRAPRKELSAGGSIVIEKDNRITAVQRADKNGKPIREDL